MLKRLRIKFIALNMTIAALVLVVALAAICIIDYRANVEDVFEEIDQRLAFTEKLLMAEEETEQALPEADASQTPPAETGASQESPEELDASKAPLEGTTASQALPEDPLLTTEEEQPFEAPMIGKGPESDRTHLPIGVYFIRDDGSVYSMPNSTATLSAETLENALESMSESDETKNHLKESGLYFALRHTPDGTLVAFVDESAVPSWKKLALTLSLIGLIALGAFFLVSIFFSRWALNPVEKTWNQQQRFIADASHELKTPLTVILANTAILKSHSNDTLKSQSQWVESTESEAKRMQELVNDMLELARPANSKAAKRERSDIDMSDLVENIALQFESVAFEKGVSIECGIKPGLHIQGNEKRLQRLTSTLIDNACKYARENSTVTVRLTGNLRDAVLSVHNEGQVIAPEDLPHVFDRFYRGDKARSSETGGFGLGLAIARDVAQEHDGDIVVESSHANGTTFTATLRMNPQV